MLYTDLEKEEFAKYTDLYNFQTEMNNKTFLVTGSKGIMGSAIIKWILYENEVHNTNTKIIASTRNPDKRTAKFSENDNIEFCAFGNETEYCRDAKVDYVIHAAAPTSNRVFKSEPVESLKVIIDGTEKMLELTRMHNASMLYFSSSEAYGTPSIDEPIPESYVGAVDSLNIRSCYTLGKKVAELMCRSYFEEYNVDVKIIRPTVILGLWQPYDSVKVECEILRCIMENRNFVMKSDGSTKKSVIYSMDAAAAAFSVLFKGIPGEAYNATNTETYCSVKERAEAAITELSSTIQIEYAQADTLTAEGYLPKYMLLEDIAKIIELGWQPLANMAYIYKIDMKRFEGEKQC